MTDEVTDGIHREREAHRRRTRRPAGSPRTRRAECATAQADDRGEKRPPQQHAQRITGVTLLDHMKRHLAGVRARPSATLLMTELALTRIFSVVMYYHFAFLAISIALFGLSASGVFAFTSRDAGSSASAPDALLAAESVVYALCTLVALFFARPAANRPDVLAAESDPDADDLRARRAAVFHGRPRRHAGHLANVGARQRGVRLGPDRRRRRLSRADSAARSRRRTGRRADRRRARADRRRALCAVASQRVSGSPPSAVVDHGRRARRTAVWRRRRSTSATRRATSATVRSSPSGIRSRASASTNARTTTGR